MKRFQNKQEGVDFLPNINQIYFIHNISEIYNEYGELESTLILTLFPINPVNIEEESQPEIITGIPPTVIGNLVEGDFCRFQPLGETFVLTSVNTEPFVANLIRENEELRQTLIANNRRIKPKINQDLVKGVHSYHVNVGHGNCSFLVIQRQSMNDRRLYYEIWLIDCSNKEMKTWDCKKQQINQTIANICDDYNISESDFYIDKCLITHVHYDHISGISDLITQCKINSNTEFWFNLKLPWNSLTYKNLLIQLQKIHVKIIEPIAGHSTPEVRIIHPYNSITAIKNKIAGRIPLGAVNKLNNASVVYGVIFNEDPNLSIIFPGDIEDRGWKRVHSSKQNFPCPKYFCISHHGSYNGHVKYCFACTWSPCLKRCRHNFYWAILMGRNNAYPGIYSLDVLCDFRYILIMTEKARMQYAQTWPVNGVKIVFKTGKVTYF